MYENTSSLPDDKQITRIVVCLCLTIISVVALLCGGVYLVIEFLL